VPLLGITYNFQEPPRPSPNHSKQRGKFVGMQSIAGARQRP
jgi:hypothetical protein